MRRVVTYLSRLFDILVRRRRDERLNEEVQNHLYLLTARFERDGLSHEDAVFAARRTFGGIDQVKVAYRDQRGWPALDTLLGRCTRCRRSRRLARTLSGSDERQDALPSR